MCLDIFGQHVEIGMRQKCTLPKLKITRQPKLWQAFSYERVRELYIKLREGSAPKDGVKHALFQSVPEFFGSKLCVNKIIDNFGFVLPLIQITADVIKNGKN